MKQIMNQILCLGAFLGVGSIRTLREVQRLIRKPYIHSSPNEERARFPEREVAPMKTVERVILSGMRVVCLSFVVVHDGGVSVAQDGSANAEKNLQLTKQKDLRAQPVKRVVALGESTTWGYSVTCIRI